MTAILLIIASFVIEAPTAAAPTLDDRLVVPGLRMGKWALTLTIEDLVRMHGTPIRVQVQAGLPPAADAVYDYVALTWDGVPVTATMLSGRTRAMVLSIGFLSAGGRRFVTDKGVAFGTLRAEVLNVYGDPTAETMPQPGETRLIYDRSGSPSI